MAADPIPFQLGGQFQPDANDLARKQALATSLLQQSLAGAPAGSMVSGHYVKPGVLGALMPALQMFASKALQSKVTQGQQDLSTRYQSAVGQALQQYMAQRNGTPGQVATGGQPVMSDSDASNLLDNDQPPTYSQPAPGPAQAQVDPTAGNPRQAAVTALASAFPQIQAIGKTDLDSIDKGAITPHDIFTNSDMSVESRKQALAGALAGAAPTLAPLQAASKTVVANDKIFNATPGGPITQAVDARTTYGPLGTVGQTPNGPLIGQAADTGEIKTPPPGTNINLNTQQTAADAFAGKLAGARADSLVASRTAAQEGVKALSQINDAQAALQNGIKSGSGADFKLTLAKVGKAFGLSDDPTVVNTEAYKSAVMNQVLGSVKTLGSNPSEADREFVNQIKGGTINLDAATLQHLLQVAKAQAGNDVLAHQHNLAINQGATGAIPSDLEAMNVPFNFSAPDLEFDPGTGRLRAPTLAPPPGKAATVNFADFVGGH